MKIYKREIRAYRYPSYDTGFCYGGGALTEWQSEENETALRREWENEFDVYIEERFVPINN